MPAPTEKIAERVSSPAARQTIVAAAGIGYRLVVFTILFLAGVALVAYGLFRLKHVLELFVLGLLLAMALNPTVVWFEKRGVPRIGTVIGLLVLMASLLGAGIATLGPRLVDESTHFVQEAPQYTQRLQRYTDRLQKRFPHLKVTDVTERLQSQAVSSLANIQGTATAVFAASVTTVAETLLVVFMVVFFLADPQPLVRGMRGLMPDAWQPEVERIGDLVVGKVEAWIQGSLILMLTIAVADTIGLAFLGIPYALLWGVLSGLLEIVPTLGPIIAAVPPILVGLAISPTTALYVIVLYTVIQQLESNLLVPWVMSNKVSLHPITLLFFLLAMAELLGIFGAIIATPAAAMLKVLYLELYYRRLHGGLPPEEAKDPIRMRRLRRFVRKTRAEAEESPAPPSPT